LRALSSKRFADARGTTEGLVLIGTVGAIHSGNALARTIVVPGERALTMGMLPRQNRMMQLGTTADFRINAAEITMGFTTVLGTMVAIIIVLLALVQAMAGPAVLIREVVNGAPEREVTVDLKCLRAIDIDLTRIEDSAVLNTVAISINERHEVNILRPVATVACGNNTIQTKVDVVTLSKIARRDLVAIK
jgi:hypothetical protein